jgi:hypothetical protein
MTIRDQFPRTRAETTPARGRLPSPPVGDGETMSRPVWRRRGSAIFMAIILGVVFFMVVSSLLHYLSGEKRQVKHVIGKKQAEVLALSGIDWADHELRKGRWYQDPWGTTITGGGRPSAGVKELAPFGPGMGKVTVVCEDVPCKQPVANIRNMQQLWLLHHINVFALGEYGDSRCLVYGRFIMSPEPALNDNSTDAVLYADQGTGNPRFAAVRFPSDSRGGRFKVLSILVGVGDQVDINKVVATLEPVGGAAGAVVELRPPTHGRMRIITGKVGQTYSGREVFAVLTKGSAAGGGGDESRTLKRMVRLTRVDDDPWGKMNIQSFRDRYALAARMKTLSDLYLMNFSARQDLMKAVNEHRGGGLPETFTPEEFLQKFPPNVTNPTRDRAENDFLAQVLRRFSVAPVKDWGEALKSTMLELDHPRMDVPPELRNKLQTLGLLGLRDTLPRREPRYFGPRIPLDEFLDLLKPEFNRNPDDFIRTLSELPDASRWIEVVEDPSLRNAAATTRETREGIEVVRPDAETRVTVQKITKPYQFVDQKAGFKVPMQHLLEFVRKVYSDDNAVQPKEEVRNIDFLDWPLPDQPGEPPPPKGEGEWVWVPGTPGVPPGPPRWSHTGGRELLVPFPSGGRRDFEPGGGPPDGGNRIYGIDGVAPVSTGRSARAAGGPPSGSGDVSTRPAGAPDGAGDGGARAGSPPGGDGAGATQPGGPPGEAGDMNATPGGAPEQESSIFSTTRPPAKIPTGGRFDGVPGPPGVPPKQGEWAWVEPCPPGGAPAGGGGESKWGQGATADGQGSSVGDGFGGTPPGGAGNADGQGLGKDGKPAGADGFGQGQDGKPGQADGMGLGKDGKPGQADGFGQGRDGGPGQATGFGTGTDGPPGRAVGDGTGADGGPGRADGDGHGNTTPSGAGAGRSHDSNGTRPTGSGPGGSVDNPVYTCPTCGKLHKNPAYQGGGGDRDGGGGSASTRGGC